MKKLFVILASAALLTACGNKEAALHQDDVPTTADSLRVALANQDSLLVLINDVAEGMLQIKQMENLLQNPVSMSAETPDQRQQIRDDMTLIQKTLQDRRDRLAELEKKLKSSSYNNETLRKSIETLKAQIAEQESTISDLRAQLGKANIRIEELTGTVDSLNTEVATVSAAKAQAEAATTAVTDQLNVCYYAIGSKSELKDHKLIETGFLRKTKIMPEDFEMSYFTKADKRTTTVIDLHSNKGKVITNQPADSYQLTTAPNGNMMLRITDPARFWQQSNFLVIQVD